MPETSVVAEEEIALEANLAEIEEAIKDPAFKGKMEGLFRIWWGPAATHWHDTVWKDTKEAIRNGALPIEILQDLRNGASIESTQRPQIQRTDYDTVSTVNGRVVAVSTWNPLVSELRLGGWCALRYESGYKIAQIMGMEVKEPNGRIELTLRHEDSGHWEKRDLAEVISLPVLQRQAFQDSHKNWIALAKELDTSHRLIAETARPHLRAGEHVLELGGGPGLSIEALAHSDARFHVLDGSLEMLEGTKRPEVAPHIESVIPLQLGEGIPIDLGRESMDHAMSNGMLYYLHSLKFTFLEVFRILKEGGTFHFSICEPQGEDGVDQIPARAPRLTIGRWGIDLQEAAWMAETRPDLANIDDGALAYTQAKWACRIEYRHRFEDIMEILRRIGFEVIAVKRSEFVHIDPATQTPTNFTYISCRKPTNQTSGAAAHERIQ